jgi:hypothetical protein
MLSSRGFGWLPVELYMERYRARPGPCIGWPDIRYCSRR